VRELLEELLEEFQQKIVQFDGAVPRDARFSTIKNKVNVVIGMRRVGKTYFLLQKIKKNIQDNPETLSQILYLNFEDDRLLPLSAPKLGELLDTFYAIYPENHHLRCYFVLDEIQNVPQWEIVVRRFLDTKNLEMSLTGSSAKLLSKEIATSLRGRAITTEIWPFSFKEYLIAKGVDLPKKPFGKISKDLILKLLDTYIVEGGFPETINLDALDRNLLLQDYVDVVIFRDIIERHNITNVHLIKYLIKTLMKQAGASFSVNKFYNDLKSQGVSVSKTTLHDYLGYLEDAYLIFTVPLYSESIRKSQTNPRKIYSIDTGLINAYSISYSNNMGHLFENLVYIELKRRNHKVYYYLTEERYEIDFLTIDPTNKIHIYQVVWDPTHPETLRRETRALKAAERELNIKGTLITPQTFLTLFLTG
jgi:predicted AAA+ superfamily ATPase